MTEVRSPSRSQIIRVTVAVVLVTGATALALWLHFSKPGTDQYAPAIQQLTTGQLKADPYGRLDLSVTFPGLTPRDEMFFARHDDGSFVAMFPTYYGPGVCIAGVMYTSRPLREQDTYTMRMATNLDRRWITVGSWSKLSLDKRIDEHWYTVSRGLH